MRKLKFMPHQKKSLDDTEPFNRVAYYLDMGLGKTFVGSGCINSIYFIYCVCNLRYKMIIKIDNKQYKKGI